MEHPMSSALNANIFQMFGSRFFQGRVECVAMFDVHGCISCAVDQKEGRSIGCNIS